MDITIRQAHPDDAQVAAPLILDAIGDIAKRITGETEWKKSCKVNVNYFVVSTTRILICTHTLLLRTEKSPD